MDLIRVQQLLEKYYDGNTSNEEEMQLKHYFQGPVSDDFQVDREIFLQMTDEKSASDPGFDVQTTLEQLVDNQEDSDESISGRLVMLSTWFYRVAALVALVLTVYLADEYIFRTEVAENQFQQSDTFENPELAYNETKKALLYLSTQLNKGTDELKNIEKLNRSIEQLTKLSEIDKAKKLIMQNEQTETENENK